MSRSRTAIRRVFDCGYGDHSIIVPDNPTARRRMVDTTVATLWPKHAANRGLHQLIEEVLATALCPRRKDRR